MTLVRVNLKQMSARLTYIRISSILPFGFIRNDLPFLVSPQKLQKFGVSTSPPKPQTPPRERSLPPRPQSLILGAPVLSRKEVQREEDEEVFAEEAREDVPISTGGERTVEGSSATENGYMELPGSFGSKSEPAVVTLEFGVARMTC